MAALVGPTVANHLILDTPLAFDCCRGRPAIYRIPRTKRADGCRSTAAFPCPSSHYANYLHEGNVGSCILVEYIANVDMIC